MYLHFVEHRLFSYWKAVPFLWTLYIFLFFKSICDCKLEKCLGMRIVMNADELEEAFTRCKSEALTAFGNDAVYVEKYISSPHHIEFQILADKHGDCIHLFERECSVQRRHQKVIEETPSPLMTPELREKMGQDAVAAAR